MPKLNNISDFLFLEKIAIVTLMNIKHLNF